MLKKTTRLPAPRTTTTPSIAVRSSLKAGITIQVKTYPFTRSRG